jgi:hypothetical protein
MYRGVSCSSPAAGFEIIIPVGLASVGILSVSIASHTMMQFWICMLSAVSCRLPVLTLLASASDRDSSGGLVWCAMGLASPSSSGLVAIESWSSWNQMSESMHIVDGVWKLSSPLLLCSS